MIWQEMTGVQRLTKKTLHFSAQMKWNFLRLFVYLSSSRPDKMVSETLLWHPMVMKTDLKGQHLETTAWGKALSTIGQAPHTAPLEKLQWFWEWELLRHGLCHWILCGLLRIVPLKIHVSAIKLVSLCKLHNHKIMLSTHWWCLPQGCTSCCSRPFPSHLHVWELLQQELNPVWLQVLGFPIFSQFATQWPTSFRLNYELLSILRCLPFYHDGWGGSRLCW